MALHYTHTADRKRLANEGPQLLLAAGVQNETACTFRSRAGARSKSTKEIGT